ncbi:FHA domain protein [Aspergillus bombycis]|uniref:FHA domain protein n=1 Tax=Aspergillus bombycis TaxID=109264 RepID=A0A1F8A6N8_9EURO|nr:FHA domain protein [Aspergillus bombycis]OGM47364.1 FHA domain protein [Aspergillus bombycis]
MPGSKAIVTLYPLDVSDVLPYRSLTFTSDSDHIEVGRASKRESKNLIPTNHNGLFDSRVMSRNHATLRVCLNNKTVYLSDGNSMHGTWVNGEKIRAGEATIVRSGDEVIFGTEVIRGHETFPPLKVRCEHQWIDSGDEVVLDVSNNHQAKRATNTFCVPDDDDDYDNEVIYDSIPAPVVTAVESSSESADSDPGSDSDDDSVMEISSPITSPPKGGDIIGSQESPIDVDSEQAEQPLATPRMTPPSTVDVAEEIRNKVHERPSHILHSPESTIVLVSEEQSVAEPSVWESEDDDQADSMNESMSESQSEYDGEESDPDRLSVRLSPTPYMAINQGIQANTTCGDYDAPNRGFYSKGKKAEGCAPDLTRQTAASCGISIPLFNTTSPCLDEPSTSWPDTVRDGANSGLPLHPSGKLFDHSLAGLHCTTFTQAMEPWQAHAAHGPAYPFSDHCSPRPPYKDGPFVNSLSQFVDSNDRDDTVVPTVTAAAPGNENMQSRSTDIEIRPTEASDDTNLSKVGVQSSSLLEKMRGPECDTLASPHNDVDPSSKATAIPRQGLKRKALDAEINSLDDDNVVIQDTYPCTENNFSVDERPTVEEDDSCLPDAQPHITVPEFGTVPSQLTELPITHASQKSDSYPLPTPANGRPSKRLKTSETANFKSHAATAALGAVVGAIGTIAILASLPADYFA